MHKRLMNVAELAEYIATTPGVVYQMVSKEQIPVVKIGRAVRFDIPKIDRWIERRATRTKERVDGKSIPTSG